VLVAAHAIFNTSGTPLHANNHVGAPLRDGRHLGVVESELQELR